MTNKKPKEHITYLLKAAFTNTCLLQGLDSCSHGDIVPEWIEEAGTIFRMMIQHNHRQKLVTKCRADRLLLIIGWDVNVHHVTQRNERGESFIVFIVTNNLD